MSGSDQWNDCSMICEYDDWKNDTFKGGWEFNCEMRWNWNKYENRR